MNLRMFIRKDGTEILQIKRQVQHSAMLQELVWQDIPTVFEEPKKPEVVEFTAIVPVNMSSNIWPQNLCGKKWRIVATEIRSEK